MNQQYVDICNVGDLNRELCDVAAQHLNCITTQGNPGICTYIDPGNVGVGICRCIIRPNLKPRTLFNNPKNSWINTCASNNNVSP